MVFTRTCDFPYITEHVDSSGFHEVRVELGRQVYYSEHWTEERQRDETENVVTEVGVTDETRERVKGVRSET